MNIWQADFYKRLLRNEKGELLWELLICDPSGEIIYEASTPQSQANATWLIERLQEASSAGLPDIIQVFRPQSLSLLKIAAETLGIKVEATRHVRGLKKQLQQRASQHHVMGEIYNPTKLEKPAPQPLPENLWGDQWRFASIAAVEIIEAFSDRPIPILSLPEFLFPVNLGIASHLPIPGVIIYGGRKSLQLARWLDEAKPVSLDYVITEVGESGGLVLESGLVDRWIVITFEDSEVAKAAQNYQQRKQDSKGLHFLLVQPDDSEITYSGFWLLGEE